MTVSPGRVVVKLQPTADDSAEPVALRVEALRRRVPGIARLVRPPSRSGRAVFELNPSADPVAVAAALAKAPGVEYAEPDVIDRASAPDAPESPAVDR